MPAGLTRAAAMIALLAILSELSFDLIGTYLIEGSQHVEHRLAAESKSETCMKRAAVASLLYLPRGQVAAFDDTAPTVLLYTPDGVTAASYRDPEALEDLYRLYTSNVSDAERIVKRRDIDYLLLCKNSPDYGFYMESSVKDGTIRRLSTGTLPNWLTRMTNTGPVEIYKVNAASIAIHDAH
jgi:hypothetical protein